MARRRALHGRKCTFDLLTDKASRRLRINPRKSWYVNVAEVTAERDYEATFHLKRPQPSFLTLLATGCSPIYPVIGMKAL